MTVDIVMPRVGGYDVETGTVIRWLKREGERLEAGEPLAEVESEKTTMQLPAPHAGTLLRIMVAEQAEVPVGTVLAVMAREGS